MVTNLAPRKMKYGISEGMVLAASGLDGPGRASSCSGRRAGAGQACASNRGNRWRRQTRRCLGITALAAQGRHWTTGRLRRPSWLGDTPPTPSRIETKCRAVGCRTKRNRQPPFRAASTSTDAQGFHQMLFTPCR